jgi:hypothetical protein
MPEWTTSTRSAALKEIKFRKDKKTLWIQNFISNNPVGLSKYTKI